MDVSSLPHKALYFSGTDMSLLVWSNKDIVNILMLECSIKMKGIIFPTPFTLYGTVPLG